MKTPEEYASMIVARLLEEVKLHDADYIVQKAAAFVTEHIRKAMEEAVDTERRALVKFFKESAPVAGTLGTPGNWCLVAAEIVRMRRSLDDEQPT